MRVVSNLVLCALVVLTTAVVSGCGGPPTKAEYEREVDTISRQANRQIGEVLDADTPPTAADLKRAGKVLDAAADDLEEIEPPAKVAEAHSRMIRGIRGIASWFSEVAVEAKDLRSDRERADLLLASAESEDARSAFEDVRWAQRTFRRSGYRVFDAAEEAAAAAATGQG